MIPQFILAASLLAPASAPIDGLTELRTIRTEESLQSLRAGAPAMPKAIDDAERTQLQAAQTSASDLAALRGGAMSDHDLMIVLVVLAAVLVIVIIA